MPKPIISTTINGTLGADTLFGDTSGTLSNNGGQQTINGLGGDDTLYGDALNTAKTTLTAGTTSSLVGTGNDTLYGDAYEMHQNSVGGNDTLNGGSENDILYGDARTMDGSAQGGNDIVSRPPTPATRSLPSTAMPVPCPAMPRAAMIPSPPPIPARTLISSRRCRHNDRQCPRWE